MPNISVTNNSSSLLALPGGYYTSPVLPGATVTFAVDNTEDFTGLPAVVALAAAGVIWISTDSSAAEERPIPCYTTAQLAGTVTASLFPTGTLVYDSTRKSPVASVSDIWRDETVVIAGDNAALAALFAIGNVPINALAYNTALATLVRNNGTTGFVACALSTAISSQAGLPAVGVLGDLTYSTGTSALMICTAPTVPGPVAWDTVFVAPVDNTAAAGGTGAAVSGGMYFNSDTSRLSFRVGAAWVHLPVVSCATTAALEVIRAVAPVNTAGQFGFDNVLNRFAIYPGGAGAAWFNETTVGMYAPAGHDLGNGVIIFDKTGFSGASALRGMLRVYDTAGAPGWRTSAVVLPIYAQVLDLPLATNVPNGYMALVNAGVGVPGHTLYAVIGGAWAHEL